MLNLFALVLVFLSSVAGSFGSYFFKKASRKFSFNILEQLKNTNLFLGMLVYIIGTILSLIALKLNSLSIIYSLSSISYVMIAIISAKLLKEKMNKNKWIGVGLIMLGIIIVTAAV